ncbi:MAG: indolepyruvate ferredoxin oxidoreductase family protein [Alphaproteobacteria bacterium]|nr:indolepyruvate ferredoxin oxidoreductase family protein [Alphaproteobacteria bacterium]
MADAGVELDDKYTATAGRVFISGIQALVRLPLVQMRRDRLAGLNTGAFIAGYRGSPLGGYDQQLARAKHHLTEHGVEFRPAVNEDLAATMIWGTQQLGLSPGAKRDGVVGIWYGKGPGVDRSGDVFKHGNAAGSARLGGVLCLAGDDHGAKSSTVPHQSDHAFMSALMPVLYPSSIHEFVELGLLGIAMSRYSGCWVGMKVIADTVETTSVVDLAAEARPFAIPVDFALPPGGLNLRWPDDRWSQDHRLQNYKGYAAIAFARANAVDRVVIDSPRARLGVVASGKAYEDVRQALRELEIDDAVAAAIGLRVYKVGMPWPLEPEGIRRFSAGLQEVVIVEERREIIENQIKQSLFNWRADVRPRIVGKFDHEDKPLLPLDSELTVGAAARVIADRLMQFEFDAALKQRIEARLRYFRERAELRRTHVAPIERRPFFCAGCPHNTSTRVPDGSRAVAGIGCHFMAQWMERSTETFTQMGGEGVPWIGVAPFTAEPHIFANLGDGTYFHSGLLAIRQAVAAGVNVTYKILYNDAVAMTGGQALDGTLTVPQITHQLRHENVKAIYLVSEAPARIERAQLAPGTIVRHRDRLDAVMREARAIPGCTAIVYDQTCAAEKRRRRKRGELVDPPRRVFINREVCEGCGDCSVQSNCIAVEPVETAMGRKRRINQSACNKDFSCLKGFCPSFVTVEGGEVRKRAPAGELGPDAAPEPATRAPLDRAYNVLVTGVGGTGVLTIGALLGMAAHLEGKACMILDMAGLAQKGGAVWSHVRLARTAAEVTSPRIVTGGADLLLAADSVVAAGKEGIALCSPARTAAVVNGHLTPVADFVRHRDYDFRQAVIESTIRMHVASEPAIEAFTEVAEAALGDAIATNVLMVGYAYQKGLLPLAAAAIERAIALNGVAVKSNVQAFRWGRLLAAEPRRVKTTLGLAPVPALADSLDELIAARARHLTDYQDAALAERYRALVARVRSAAAAAGLDERLAHAVARNYAKLLAYKDEYEVARLFTNGAFARDLASQFAGDYRLTFHLAPPFLPGRDANGRPKKREFAAWTLALLRVLARARRLRGTAFDPFGYASERRAERVLIADYEATIERMLPRLAPANVEAAIALAALADDIRGFGPIKAAAIAAAEARKAALWAAFDHPGGGALRAAAE